MNDSLRSRTRVLALPAILRVAVTMIGFGLLLWSFAFALPVSAQTAPTFTVNQTIGSTGTEVTALQNWLISRGYSIPAGATGYFGSQTRAALAGYQAANGIVPAVGYFGPITRASLQTPVPVPTPPATGTEVAQGDDADTDDRDEDRVTADEAEDALEDTRSELKDANKEVKKARRDKKDTDDAEDDLDEAEELLDEAEESYDDENYNEVMDLVGEAEDLIEDALNELESGDEDEAADAIDEARDDLDDARDEVEEAEDDDLDTGDAEDLLDEAEELLDEADDAFDDEDYDEVMDLVDEANDLIEEALDEIETGDKKNSEDDEESDGEVTVTTLPLLTGGTIKAGETKPVSYLYLRNTGDEEVRITGFEVKQNGSADAGVITELSTVDDKGGSRGTSDEYPFDDGIGFAPTDATIEPGALKLFTIKATIGTNVTVGTNLKLDVVGVRTNGTEKASYPLKGTTWTIGS